MEKLETEKLPIVGLISLSVMGFLVIMTENTPSGLLPFISSSLHVSISLAGQLLTFYALGSVLSAIPIVAITRRLNRKPLLISTIVALVVFNAITALSASYFLTIVARFIAGMASGVVWALLPGYAKNMSPIQKQGRAMSIVGMGQPIAFCLGVPLATWLGTIFSWRGVFGCISLIAMLLIVLILIFVPNFPGKSIEKQKNIYQVIKIPGIVTLLSVIFMIVFAHNLLYTYITSFLVNFRNSRENTSIVLLAFGISALLGILFVGYLIDKNLLLTLLGYLFIFSISGILLFLHKYLSVPLMAGVICWGFSFGGLPVILQTATVNFGKSEADLAISMMVTIFNFAVAGGAFIGGLLLNLLSVNQFPLLLAVIGFLGLLIALTLRGSNSIAPTIG